MQKCQVCGQADFYKESGFFFCSTCQTQNEEIREEILEVRIDTSTKLRKRRICRIRSDKTDERLGLGWTSWELYNFVLIGLTNELIELGAPSDIKVTVLQLWARYLGKLEIAFTSTKKKLIPKLARRYKKRDAEIIYGKVLSQNRAKKRKRSGSSITDSRTSTYQSEGSLKEFNRNKRLMITADYDRFIQSQTSSEGDALSATPSAYSMQSSTAQSFKNDIRIQFTSSAKKEIKKIKNMAKKLPRHKRNKYRQSHVTTQYKLGLDIITPMRLWAILYLALRIHNHSIHLGDMLRYGREGHLSYYKLDHLIPPEITLTRSNQNLLSRVTDITHKGMRRTIGSMAKFLGVTKIICPDLSSLISRYCVELELPEGISLYGKRFIALSPPKMKFDKKSSIPNYEGRAMAFIIVILKTLLALDGVTEYEISNVAEKINSDDFISQKYSHNDIKKLNMTWCQDKDFDTPCIFVHGSTGNSNDALTVEKMMSCKIAASNGYQSLLNHAGSVKAVETALWWLECDEFFNCGYGSLLNEIGDVEMNATIIDGSKFECGSVAMISDIEHPISLAKYVLDNFPNSIIVGEGARKLAKYADLNWLSKKNMIAPLAYLSYKLESTDCLETNWDIENNQQAEVLQSKAQLYSGSTVGCVAYDGYTIAAGITSGGLNKKLVGSTSGSSVLGCNVYANRSVGCSLTGHAEFIMKLGLSRAIANDIERGCAPFKALKENLDNMLTKYNQAGGGIAFEKSGEWSVYFTSDNMPYAVISNNRMTFGTTLNNKIIEVHAGYRDDLPAISDEGISNRRLFSFREWQRYIECRRTVLINTHFPTRIKYDSNIPDVNSLYIKFMESMHSKADGREVPEITTHKHLIPRNIIDAMKQCITNVNYIDLSLEDVNIFTASLTPHHSYLQELLRHPRYDDIPSMLRNNFSSTKIRFMTNSQCAYELALQYNITLNFTDSNLHFIEKIVPFFEQTRISSVKELKDKIVVYDLIEVEIEGDKKEDFINYVHRKIPCRFKIDMKKKQYHDNMRMTNANAKAPALVSSDEFIFDEISSNGKLLIPDSDNKDNESDEDDCSGDNFSEEARSLLFKFSEMCNINLSKTEKKAMFTNMSWKRKQKSKSLRNAQGKFIKRNVSSTQQHDIENSNEIHRTEQFDIPVENFEIEDLLPEITEICNSNNTRICSNTTQYACDDHFESCGKFKPKTDKFLCTSDVETNNTLRLFRPFKDYWTYHCNFGRVKPKNFELFEKMLPKSFQWLLNECASVIEMPTEDLYEEVCLIETYYANISEQAGVHTSNTDIESHNQMYINAALNKW